MLAFPSALLYAHAHTTHVFNTRQTIVLQDVRADPTLPRTRDVACPDCGHTEAVFFSQSSEQGMTLYFQCCSCGKRWQENV